MKKLPLAIALLCFSGCLKPAAPLGKFTQQALLSDAVELLSAQTSDTALQISIQRDQSNVPKPAPTGLAPVDFSEQLEFSKDSFGNLTYSPALSTYGLTAFQVACKTTDCSDLNVVLQRANQDGSRDSAGFRLLVVQSVSCTLTSNDGTGAIQKSTLAFPNATISVNLDRGNLAAFYGRASALDSGSGQIVTNYLRSTLGTAGNLYFDVVQSMTNADGSTHDNYEANMTFSIKTSEWDETKKTFDITAIPPKTPKGSTTLHCTY